MLEHLQTKLYHQRPQPPASSRLSPKPSNLSQNGIPRHPRRAGPCQPLRLTGTAILPRVELSTALPTLYYENSSRQPSIPEPIQITWTRPEAFAKGGNATARTGPRARRGGCTWRPCRSAGIIGVDGPRRPHRHPPTPFSATGRLRRNLPGGGSSWCSASPGWGRASSPRRGTCVTPGVSYRFSPAYLDRDRLPNRQPRRRH